MKQMQMREAKARLSEVVETARRGEPVTITRHGTPVAVVVSVEEAERLRPSDRKRRSIVDVLRDFPGDGTEFERDRSPVREIDL